MHAQSYFREWFELIVKLMDRIDGFKFYQNFCCRKSWYMNPRKKTDGLYEKNPISWIRKAAIMACYLVNWKILDFGNHEAPPFLDNLLGCDSAWLLLWWKHQSFECKVDATRNQNCSLQESKIVKKGNIFCTLCNFQRNRTWMPVHCIYSYRILILVTMLLLLFT